MDPDTKFWQIISSIFFMQEGNTTQPDHPFRLDPENASDVVYLQNQFPAKKTEEIMNAIRNYGPFTDKIVHHLNRSKDTLGWEKGL
jgi:hypothetical protein